MAASSCSSDQWARSPPTAITTYISSGPIAVTSLHPHPALSTACDRPAPKHSGRGKRHARPLRSPRRRRTEVELNPIGVKRLRVERAVATGAPAWPLRTHRAGSARLTRFLQPRPAQMPVARPSRSHSPAHRCPSGRVYAARSGSSGLPQPRDRLGPQSVDPHECRVGRQAPAALHRKRPDPEGRRLVSASGDDRGSGYCRCQGP